MWVSFLGLTSFELIQDFVNRSDFDFIIISFFTRPHLFLFQLFEYDFALSFHFYTLRLEGVYLIVYLK